MELRAKNISRKTQRKGGLMLHPPPLRERQQKHRFQKRVHTIPLRYATIRSYTIHYKT
jgi:hypothetical protein